MLVTETAVKNMEENTHITSTAYECENTDFHFYFFLKNERVENSHIAR